MKSVRIIISQINTQGDQSLFNSYLNIIYESDKTKKEMEMTYPTGVLELLH